MCLMCINIDFSVNICLVDNVCVPLVMLKIRNFSSSSFKSQLGQGIVDMFVSTCRWCLCSMVQKNNNKLCCIPRSWDPDVTDSVSQNRQYLMSTTSAYKSMFLLWTMFFFFFCWALLYILAVVVRPCSSAEMFQVSLGSIEIINHPTEQHRVFPSNWSSQPFLSLYS